MILGMVTVIFATFGLLAGCLPTSTGTGTDATTGSSSSFYIMIGFIVILFALMYFFTIRPQRKRQQNQARMITELQKGDKVVTIGGLYGTVESASEDSVVLRVESGTTMRFVKSAIATKVTQQPQTGPQ
jgi:preprotein translocase subunit YajC